jgi:hypothetical protein
MFLLVLLSLSRFPTHDELIYAGLADGGGDAWSWPLLGYEGLVCFLFLFFRGYR